MVYIYICIYVYIYIYIYIYTSQHTHNSQSNACHHKQAQRASRAVATTRAAWMYSNICGGRLATFASRPYARSVTM